LDEQQKRRSPNRGRSAEQPAAAFDRYGPRVDTRIRRHAKRRHSVTHYSVGRAAGARVETAGLSPKEQPREPRPHGGALPPRTTSIRAAKPLLARLLHRQSMGALTGRAAFPSHGLRSRNRLDASASHVERQTTALDEARASERPTRTRALRQGETKAQPRPRVTPVRRSCVRLRLTNGTLARTWGTEVLSSGSEGSGVRALRARARRASASLEEYQAAKRVHEAEWAKARAGS
jgi:hypothetical protein